MYNLASFECFGCLVQLKCFWYHHLSNLCFFYFFLIYYSVGTIWITTKLCHIRFNLTRQSNRIKESRIFRFDWIYVGPSIGTQLSLLKGSQFRSKCGRSDPKGYCRVDTLVCLLNYQADGSPFWNQFLVVALRDAERMSSTMSVYNVRFPRPLSKSTWVNIIPNTRRRPVSWNISRANPYVGTVVIYD